jgi:3-oxoacyl-[acyl-carrier protein] reductase
VLTGRREDALVAAADRLRTETGATADHLVADVADPGSAEFTLKTVEQRHGPVDVLVLNAGGPPPGRVLELADDDWRAAVELLLLGPLRLARGAVPGMAERGFGRVVAVTSTLVRQPAPDVALSVVVRSALTSALKLLAAEHAADGVTVNCVAPGPTDTARRTQILATRAAATGRTVASIERADLDDVPAGRPAAPDEIGAAVAFLASADAAYVNGTVLTVDGGRTESVG